MGKLTRGFGRGREVVMRPDDELERTAGVGFAGRRGDGGPRRPKRARLLWVGPAKLRRGQPGPEHRRRRAISAGKGLTMESSDGEIDRIDGGAGG